MVDTEQTGNSCKSCNGVEQEPNAQKDSNEKLAKEVNKIIAKVLKKGKNEIKSDILDKYKDQLVGKRIIIKVAVVTDTTSQTELPSISCSEKITNELSTNLVTSYGPCNPNLPFYCIDEITGDAIPCTKCCPNGL
ncbi:MAG TPA: hypothetical protein VK184_08635 [Nostocaceae cyanobacterium]|nr:hypothetical protein [Nostocaceae cyanobacterium]